MADSDDLSKRALVLDFFASEADRSHQRTDWFLIFHAILFEAFNGADDGSPAELAIGIFGLVSAWLWLMAGLRQRWLMKQLGAAMGSEKIMGSTIATLYGTIMSQRRTRHQSGFYRWAKPTPIFCVVIPLLCTAVWVVLLGFHAIVMAWVGTVSASQLDGRKLAWALAAMIVTFFLTVALGDGPTLPEQIKEELANAAKDSPAEANAEKAG